MTRPTMQMQNVISISWGWVNRVTVLTPPRLKYVLVSRPTLCQLGCYNLQTLPASRASYLQQGLNINASFMCSSSPLPLPLRGWFMRWGDGGYTHLLILIQVWLLLPSFLFPPWLLEFALVFGFAAAALQSPIYLQWGHFCGYNRILLQINEPAPSLGPAV